VADNHNDQRFQEETVGIELGLTPLPFSWRWGEPDWLKHLT
jgi:hypothetical protein